MAIDRIEGPPDGGAYFTAVAQSMNNMKEIADIVFRTLRNNEGHLKVAEATPFEKNLNRIDIKV